MGVLGAVARSGVPWSSDQGWARRCRGTLQIQDALRPLERRAPALVLVVIWAALAWAFLRPEGLAFDWNGWRQADTQTIALDLASGGRLLYPRIAWGGDGPGYVEAELQLYPALLAPLLRAFGRVEWPGQAVSLLALSAAAVIVGGLLSSRFPPLATALGVGAFLSTRSVLHLATAVQPDALSVLLFVAALACFLRFEESAAPQALCGFALWGGLAMLVKPGAAQIGIATFLILLLRSRAKLASPGVWMAWGAMVLALAAHLLFARGIYLEYGNTFGVLSGGDSKLPRAEHLLKLGLYRDAAHVAIAWGVGPVAALCATVLLVRRRLDAVAWGLLVGAVAWTLLTLRYSAEEAYGSHYPVLAAAASAWVVAQLAVRLPRRSLWWVVLSLALLAQYASSFAVRREHLRSDRGAHGIAEIASALDGTIAPGDLVVVRSGTFAYDAYWKTPNNFQDPRFFYLSKTRGFMLGSDQDDPAVLEAWVRRGARFYVEPDGRYATPRIDAWLQRSAMVVARSARGRAWRLKSPSG